MSEQMRPDETIPGGLYKGADGTFHDANGNPVDAPKAKPSKVVKATPQEPETTVDAPKE